MKIVGALWSECIRSLATVWDNVGPYTWEKARVMWAGREQRRLYGRGDNGDLACRAAGRSLVRNVVSTTINED